MGNMVWLALHLAMFEIKDKKLYFLQSQENGEVISSQKLLKGKQETTGPYGKIHQ